MAAGSTDDDPAPAPYSGYVAEAEHLRARLRWLEDRIAAGDPAPDPVTARLYGIWPPAPAGAGAQPVGRAPQPAPAPASAQALLLTLGAGLLVVAGIVFSAVVWDQLGAVGQAGLLAVATVVAGVAAVRLAGRLGATAEALATVAFGLATVDLVAAPALGLVPRSWLAFESPYPALVAGAVAVVAVVLGHRCRLRAWVWLGWIAAAVAAAVTTGYLAAGVFDGQQPWWSLSVAVVAVAAVVLPAVPYLWPQLIDDRAPTALAGTAAGGVAAVAWLVGVSDLDAPSILGTLGATVCAAAAAAWVWRSTSGAVATVAAGAAAVLAGIAAGLAPLLTTTWQPVWLGAAVGLLGAALVAATSSLTRDRRRTALLAAAVLWTTWALGRLAMAGPAQEHEVLDQLAALLVVVSLTWFAVAAWLQEPWIAWFGAVAGEAALLAATHGRTGPVESWSLPLAALLLVAGVVWSRSVPDAPSLGWLGPGVAAALLPSAFACWAAPWVAGGLGEEVAASLVRLLAVLVLGVLAVTVGVRLRLAGLVLPGSAALVVTGVAQVWGGLAAAPRWVAIAAAGVALLAAGARLEWLRSEGTELSSYMGSLR